MVLTGTYNRNLDQKHRVALPKRLREGLGPDCRSVFIAPGTETSLELYSLPVFEERAQLLARKQEGASRNYMRLFYSQAEQVDVDGQGRIRLPDRLVQFGKLGREVVIIGVHDHVEIWDLVHWKSFVAEHAKEFDQMADDAFRTGQ